jgi:antitoxin component YwqK of YwqJK toxin-antitoxin module
VVQILHYQADKKEGPAMMYYPSGVVLERGGYHGDQKEGVFYGYYETGVLRVVSQWQAGRLFSQTLYTPEGQEAP